MRSLDEIFGGSTTQNVRPQTNLQPSKRRSLDDIFGVSSLKAKDDTPVRDAVRTVTSKLKDFFTQKSTGFTPPEDPIDEDPMVTKAVQSVTSPQLKPKSTIDLKGDLDVAEQGFGNVVLRSMEAGGRGILSTATQGINLIDEKLWKGSLIGLSEDQYRARDERLAEYSRNTQKRLEEQIGAENANSFVSQAIQGIGQGVVQIGVAIANPVAGAALISAMSVGAGKGAYDQAYDTLIEQGKSEEEARRIANINGFVTGAVNGLEAIPVFRTLGLTKDILNKPINKAISATVVRVLKNAGVESGTEGLQQFGEDITAKLTYDPDRPTVKNAIMATLVSIPTGLLFGGVGEVGVRKQAKSQERNAALKKAASDIQVQLEEAGVGAEAAEKTANIIVTQYALSGNEPIFDIPGKETPGQKIKSIVEGVKATTPAQMPTFNEKLSSSRPQENDPLMVEARKYKSAEEFVDTQVKAFHGTNDNFKVFNPKKGSQGVIWFTDNADTIKRGESGAVGTKNIMERYLTGKNFAGWDEYEKLGLGQIQDQGFDGIKLPQNGYTDYVLFDNKGIKTREELTDIYNKAVGGDKFTTLRENLQDFNSAEGFAQTFTDPKKYKQFISQQARKISKLPSTDQSGGYQQTYSNLDKYYSDIKDEFSSETTKARKELLQDFKDKKITLAEYDKKLKEIQSNPQQKYVDFYNKEQPKMNKKGNRVPLSERPAQPQRIKEYQKRLRLKGADPMIVDVIVTPDNGRAYGVSYAGTISLEKVVQDLTEDHEMMHQVMANLEDIRLFKKFSKAELLAEARDLYGEDLSDTELEEQMALDFQQYVKEREANTPTTFFGKIEEFFQRLYASIKRIFRTDTDIQEFYRVMTEGKASEDTTISNEASESFLRKAKDGVVDFRRMDVVREFLKETPVEGAFNDSGDLTLKTIQKLEGRKTVSKQFIEDLTNSGDIKQVERDLIRDVLKDEGSTVDVPAFVAKVKAELLPLTVRELGTGDRGSRTAKYEFVNLPDDLRGNVANYAEHIYESPIKTSAGSIHFSPVENPGYFGHTRVEDMAGPMTNTREANTMLYDRNTGLDMPFSEGSVRRIIEVQSDLYQKGGVEGARGMNRSSIDFARNENLVKDQVPTEYKNYVKAHDAFERATTAKARNETSAEMVRIERIAQEKGLSKLQQYNNPTAHFRMVREEIKRAAQDGKTKLQFPTGETAMKIEGLGTQGGGGMDFAINGSPIEPQDLKVGREIWSETQEQDWVITEVMGNGKFRAISKELADETDPEALVSTGRAQGEMFDISGEIDTNNPIYRFYEKDLARYLKNNYDAVHVTDDKGVTWMEVPVDPMYAELPVPAFNKKPEDMTPQEILAAAEARARGDVIPEKGPRNITQAEDIARISDNQDDFEARLRGGEEAVQPFYVEDAPVTVTNPNYDAVIAEIRAEGYANLEDFFMQNRAKVEPKRMKKETPRIKSLISKGTFSETEIEEMLSPTNIEAEKVRSTPTNKLDLPENLKAMQTSLEGFNYLIEETGLTLKGHPGKELQRFISKTEGQFLDDKVINAKTPAEFTKKNEEAKARKAQIQTVLDKASLDRGMAVISADDPDAIRAEIEDYKNQQARLERLIEERKQLRKDFYAQRNAYWVEERDRIALNNIVSKEEYIKSMKVLEKAMRQEGRDRKSKIEAIRDHFYLTPKEMIEVIGDQDYRTLTDKEFNALTKKIQDKAFEIAQHQEAVNEVLYTINQKELKLVENYQEALGLSKDIKKISTEDLIKLNESLGTFERGDVFLGVREIDTLARNTELSHVKTRRQILEAVLPGLTPEQIEKISPSKLNNELNEFKNATNLSQENAFFRALVLRVREMTIDADINFNRIREKTNELAKKARASRPRRLLDRLVPTDELVVKYLEEGDTEIKGKIAAKMTPQELEFANYIRDRYADMRDYLIKHEQLDRYRENYYTHKPRSFWEAWLKNEYTDVVPGVNGEMIKTKTPNVVKRFFKALKETIFDVARQEEAVFNILNEKTGEVLALEKFFKYSQKRTGQLIPSKNVANTFLSYTKTFETKKAIDAYSPVLEATARALTPLKTTEKGLIEDDRLLEFTKKFLNTQRGRPVRYIAAPGGKVDRIMSLLVTVIRFKDLALRFAPQAASYVGEYSSTFINIGPQKMALGLTRSKTKQGRALIKKYQSFVGDPLLDKLTDSSKNIGSKIGELFFAGYAASSRSANIVHMLGQMTKEEYSSGTISKERLAEIENEIGRYRSVDSVKSIFSATPEGKIVRQHKSWALAILQQTSTNLRKLSKMASAKDFKGVVESREFRELARETLLVLILGFFAYEKYKELQDKKDRNFSEELAYRALNDAYSFLAALGPGIWGVAPRVVTWLNDLAKAVDLLTMGIIHGDRDSKGNIPGSKKVIESFTPRILSTSSEDKDVKVKNKIKDAYLAGNTAKAKELADQAVADGILKKESIKPMVTQLKKEKKIDEVFTSKKEKRWVERYQGAQSTEDKVQVLLQARQSLGKDDFIAFAKKGSQTIKSASSGENLPILISDNVRKAYLQALKETQ